MLVSVDAPHFNAGIVIERGVVVRAAPILGYLVGWDCERASAYLKGKGWRAIVVKAAQ